MCFVQIIWLYISCKQSKSSWCLFFSGSGVAERENATATGTLIPLETNKGFWQFHTFPIFSPCFLSDPVSIVQGFAWVIMGVGIYVHIDLFAFCVFIYIYICVRMQFECQATRFLDRTIEERIEERIADEPSTGHCANMSRCIHRLYIFSDTLFWCDTCVILCLFFFW